MQSSESIAAVAFHYRLNANLLRRWVAAKELGAIEQAQQSKIVLTAQVVPLQINATESTEMEI